MARLHGDDRETRGGAARARRPGSTARLECGTSARSSRARRSRSASSSLPSPATATCSSRTCPGRPRPSSRGALAGSVEGATVSRIQCTPDLQPTDVTGLSVWDPQDRRFEFRPGPIFANVLLVDEINRALPKAQSALLEGMAERQVTVDGTSRPLPSPFFLIATENSIEQEGTFPLPEAQLDRFFLRTSLGYPTLEQELEILDNQLHGHPLERLRAGRRDRRSRRARRRGRGGLRRPAPEALGGRARPGDARARAGRSRCVRARQPLARAGGAGVGALRRPELRRARGRGAALRARRRPPARARGRLRGRRRVARPGGSSAA